MTIRTILEQVALKYATIDWTSLNKMEDIMVTPLDDVMQLDSHVTRMSRHINMSVAAGFNVEEYRRVKIFRHSVQHDHQIAKTLESYDKDQPNPKTHTFAAITQHVKTQLPPILSAAGAMATGRAFI